MITAHARKEHRYGTTVYVGYIKTKVGMTSWTQSTCIACQTKANALIHAERLKQSHIDRARNSEQWP